MAGLVAKLDTEQELTFLPLDDPRAVEILPSLTPDERKESGHLEMPGGDDLTSGPGIEALFIALKWTHLLGLLLRLLHVRPLLGFSMACSSEPDRHFVGWCPTSMVGAAIRDQPRCRGA